MAKREWVWGRNGGGGDGGGEEGFVKYWRICVWRLRPDVLVADIAEHHIPIEVHLCEAGATVEENQWWHRLGSFYNTGVEGGFRVGNFQGNGADK